MGVETRNLMTRRTYSFSKAKTASTTSVIVHRSINITFGETAELCVRVHAHTNAEATNKIRVVATPVSLTPEEPDIDFLAASAVSIVDLATHATGTLLLDSFTEPFGNAIQLSVEGCNRSLIPLRPP